jgi:agmatine deiminase
MGKDHVLISDRIFDENPEYQDENELVAEIECLLEAKVIIIPQINRDFTGHADGMVRWYNEDTILGNCREDEYKYWSKGIDRVLKKYDLHYIDVPFFEPPKNKRYSAIGVYVNFLEVQDLIVLPVFGVEGNHDDDVVRLFQDHFPNRKITTIDYNEIAKEGGLLNCTTWTVKE